MAGTWISTPTPSTPVMATPVLVLSLTTTIYPKNSLLWAQLTQIPPTSRAPRLAHTLQSVARDTTRTGAPALAVSMSTSTTSPLFGVASIRLPQLVTLRLQSAQSMTPLPFTGAMPTPMTARRVFQQLPRLAGIWPVLVVSPRRWLQVNITQSVLFLERLRARPRNSPSLWLGKLLQAPTLSTPLNALCRHDLLKVVFRFSYL